MESIIQICLYIAVSSGGLMIVLLLLSLVGGLDLDIDLGDTDVDAGGLGILKSILTFFSIGSLTTYLMLKSSMNPYLTFLVGAVAGILAVVFLAWVLRLLLGLQSDVNWELHQAEGKSGKVYLKIPEEGTGIIQVDINGVTRELKAKTREDVEIASGAEVLVLEVQEEIAEVILYNK